LAEELQQLNIGSDAGASSTGDSEETGPNKNLDNLYAFLSEVHASAKQSQVEGENTNMKMTAIINNEIPIATNKSIPKKSNTDGLQALGDQMDALVSNLENEVG